MPGYRYEFCTLRIMKTYMQMQDDPRDPQPKKKQEDEDIRKKQEQGNSDEEEFIDPFDDHDEDFDDPDEKEFI